MDPESGRKTGYWIITGEMKPKEGYDAKNKIEEECMSIAEKMAFGLSIGLMVM